MATQYIGARYVPIFAEPAEWNDTRTYEPLTVVLHSGNSYTSKQYVPVGIDIDNDKFWAETGDYNAQVEQYRQDVIRYATEVNNVSAALNAEVERATAAEKVNADAITAEQERATAAEKVNADAIAAEQERATAAEKVNADAIATATRKRSIDVFQIANPTDVSVTSSVILTDKIGLIDCGHGMVDSVVTFMESNNYDKFDYIVFTHMHVDHIEKTSTQIAKLKPYIGSDTPIYIQMCPNSSFAEYDSYIEGYNIATNLGAVTVPNDGSTVALGNTSLTFYNTNPANIDSYSEYSELNIFSLVCRIDFEGSSYVDCGDIYWTAQNKYTNIGNCDLFKWPHHGVNYWDSYSFISQFNAKAYIASPDATGKLFPAQNTDTYICKWARQVPNQNGYYQTLDGNTKLNIIDGSVSSENARSFIPKAADGFIGAFDVDANDSDDIDDYKNWSLYQMMNKMSRLPFNSEFIITRFSTYNALFVRQLYAFYLGMKKISVSELASHAVRVTKTQYFSSPMFLFDAQNLCTCTMALNSNYEISIGKLPDFASFDEVYNRYIPEDVNTSQAKTLVGELYDAYGDVAGIPRVYFNGIRTFDIFGSYMLGKQTFLDFAKMGYLNSGFYRAELKPIVFKTNVKIGSLTAETVYTIVLQPNYNNHSGCQIRNGHVQVFMANETHFQFFEDNILVYDSATDTENKISFISRM